MWIVKNKTHLLKMNLRPGVGRFEQSWCLQRDLGVFIVEFANKNHLGFLYTLPKLSPVRIWTNFALKIYFANILIFWLNLPCIDLGCTIRRRSHAQKMEFRKSICKTQNKHWKCLSSPISHRFRASSGNNWNDTDFLCSTDFVVFSLFIDYFLLKLARG